MPLPANGKTLCICQICECGRHKCPHSPVKTQYDADCLLSEYNNVYTGKSVERTQPIKPQAMLNPDHSPFAKDTTTNLAYIAHSVHPPMQREKQVWIPSSVPLESSTTARDHYIEHKSLPAKSMRPAMSLHRNAGKVSDVTSHRLDYTPKQFEKVEPAADYSSLTTVPGPFEDSTTQKTDYKEYSTRPRTSFTPHHSYKTPTIPMDGLTNHKADYAQWELPKRTARKAAEFVPTTGKTGTTTFKTDFTGKHARRPSPCLPQQGNMEGGEFYGTTTFRDNYLEWPVHAPYKREPATYNPTDAPLDSMTCYREDFVPKDARPKTCKPRLKYRAPSGTMATSTTHKDTFQRWNAKPSSPAQDHHTREIPPPFEGCSTYKDHYNECTGAPALLIAPPNTYNKSAQPVDSETTYSRDFTKKGLQNCPANLLPSTPTMTKSGHRFYSTVNRMMQPTIA